MNRASSSCSAPADADPASSTRCWPVTPRWGSSPTSRIASGPNFRSGWQRPSTVGCPRASRRRVGCAFAPSEGYRILDAAVSPVISTPARDLVAEDATPWLADRFRGFFLRQARAQGSPTFLHKFTGWPRARFIDAILPSARFVHVVRDGRAVANSLLQMPWWRGYRGLDEWGWGPLPERYEKEWDAADRSFPVLAAIEWKLLMDEFDAARQAIPADRWLEVRFEDFLHDPVERTREILAFSGLTWTDAFGRNFRHHVFDKTRKDAFRRDLASADVDQIEAVLGEHLERLGYLDTFGGEGIAP